MVSIVFGCLAGAEPINEVSQEKGSVETSTKPLFYEGFWTDFMVLSLLIIYPVLFLDGVTTINAADTPWVYSGRIVWLYRLLVDIYFYEEPIPVVRPMPQCRPPWPAHLLEPEIEQPLEPRDQLIRVIARYKLRVILQWLGVL